MADPKKYKQPLTAEQAAQTPARAEMLRMLGKTEWLSFREIQRALDVSEGQTSDHAKMLAKHGLIEIRKRFVDKYPRTEYRITAKGRGLL